MKCVKNQATNEIKRVKNDMAQTMVNSGAWIFVPKSEWKPKIELIVVTEKEKKKVPGRKNRQDNTK